MSLCLPFVMLARADADVLPQVLGSATLKHSDLHVSVQAEGHSFLVESMASTQWLLLTWATNSSKGSDSIGAAEEPTT